LCKLPDLRNRQSPGKLGDPRDLRKNGEEKREKTSKMEKARRKKKRGERDREPVAKNREKQGIPRRGERRNNTTEGNSADIKRLRNKSHFRLEGQM